MHLISVLFVAMYVSLVPFHSLSPATIYSFLYFLTHPVNPILVFYSFQLYNPLTTILSGCLTLFLSSHL